MNEEDDAQHDGRMQHVLAIGFALFIHALFAGLAILGALVIHAMFRAWRTGEVGSGEAIGIGLFGVLMAVIGGGFFYVAYVGAPRFLGRLDSDREKYRDRPWLNNRQWRARRIVHSTRYTAWFMWFWCICWWAILGFLWSVNKDLLIADLRGPWDQAIPSALPFAAGIIGLLFAVSLSWRRWRYGDAVLLIETLPGYLGGRFQGRVLARLAGRLTDPVGLILSCGRVTRERVASSSGGFETVIVTDTLWIDRQQLRPSQTIYSRGRVALPVRFDLPVDQPESGHIADDPQIVWKLEVDPASAKDGSLKCEFQVPVFARRIDA